MYKDIPMFAKDFLNYLQTIRGLSKGTIKEYYFDIKIYLKFMLYRLGKVSVEEENILDIDITKMKSSDLKGINLMDLHAYISYRDNYRANNSTTRARKVSSLRTFYKYLNVVSKELDENPTIMLESPKPKKRNPVYFTLDEAKKLLSTISQEKDNFIRTRDFAIVLLFLTTGIRLSELVGLNVKSIRGLEFSVIGKGNKERLVYMTEACKYAIQEYLAFRPDVVDEDALFLSRRKSRLSERTIQHSMDKYLLKAGFDVSRYSVHKLRHTAATLMFREGVDIRTLQMVLGHASVYTTQIYTHVVDDNLKKAIESNPLSNI